MMTEKYQEYISRGSVDKPRNWLPDFTIDIQKIQSRNIKSNL